MSKDYEPGGPGALPRLEERFALVWNEVRVGAFRLQLPEIADPTDYIEQRLAASEGRRQGLPYWTKLWPAAMIMSQFALRLAKGKGTLLELEAGLGLPGLVAAAGGRQVVLSGQDPDALEFARAAVEKNGLQERVSVVALDWDDPPAGLHGFSTVLGCELLDDPLRHPRLVELLGELLRPGGTAFVCHEARPLATTFLDLAAGRFSLRRTVSRLGSGDEAVTVHLFALTAKQAA